MAGRCPQALLQTCCSICSSLRQCHSGKRANIGKAPSHRTPPPREHRAQAQSGHMCTCLMQTDAFYPHEMGPCGASPISKQHQVGPAALSQHQVSCSSPGASYCQPVPPIFCQRSSAHMFWDGDRSLNAFKCPTPSSTAVRHWLSGEGCPAGWHGKDIGFFSMAAGRSPGRSSEQALLLCPALQRQAWKGH